MKELLQSIDKKEANGQDRLLYLFVDSKEYEYAGDWQWDLQSSAVFCSDVMLSLSAHFEGTKGIIHPNDKELVQERVASTQAVIPFLQFRIITTYGEIKVLTGRNLQAAEVTSLLSAELEQHARHQETSLDVWQHTQKLAWQKRATELSERITATGTWYYQLATNQVAYSDQVFHIYGVPRQSLNAHLNTFTPFIHPDDREIISEHFGRALREQLPLQLDFRIITPKGTTRTVRQVTHWEFNEWGGMMLYGSVQDITEQQATEQKLLDDQYELQLKNKLLLLNEQTASQAHWYINLVTRKVVYSENMYRLHGIRAAAMPASPALFNNFVHPDERRIVSEVYKKILHQHTPPDLDYRIVRPDGKIRHLRQRGRLVGYGESEMLMLVTLQDVTAEMLTAEKLADLRQQLSLLQAQQLQTEAQAESGSWIWEPETEKLHWSENLYNLLGLKSSSVEVTYKHLVRAIYPDDRKRFDDEMTQAIQEKRTAQLQFRMVRLGEVRQVRATLQVLEHGPTMLCLGVLQDVTRQANLEQELDRQVTLCTAITENMLDRAIITDTENTIRVWNRCCEKIYGLKKEAVLGKNLFDVFPQLKTETELSLINQALHGEAIHLPYAKAKLRQEVHNLHLIPLRDEDDNVTGVLHLLHDVTKEHELQQRLSERLNFIESLLEASVDRILVMDRYMNYLYCNTKAAQFYNLRKEDIIGKNVLEVFPASVNDPTHHHFRKALKGETVHLPAIEGISELPAYEVFLIPIMAESETVSAVLWIHHDLEPKSECSPRFSNT